MATRATAVLITMINKKISTCSKIRKTFPYVVTCIKKTLKKQTKSKKVEEFGSVSIAIKAFTLQATNLGPIPSTLYSS